MSDICTQCGGTGYIEWTDVETVCCERPYGYECCGSPEQAPVLRQDPCDSCDGTGVYRQWDDVDSYGPSG